MQVSDFFAVLIFANGYMCVARSDTIHTAYFMVLISTNVSLPVKSSTVRTMQYSLNELDLKC